MLRSKFFSKKVVVDGITFDSKKEGEYYLKLKEDEKKGLIRDLERQKEYVLLDSFKINGKTRRKTVYKCDFKYITVEDGQLHIVDIKSPYTAKDKVYRLKKKMFEYKYGIELEEII